ncbi:tryptophan synthase beta subunit-like PLP-dependent enzyme [Mycena sp. CBHHK59/15]|nr:tryptophan synthase beta subunit-like PLP-dependent enzyme [Mycena sp. CBHHK59/15]
MTKMLTNRPLASVVPLHTFLCLVKTESKTVLMVLTERSKWAPGLADSRRRRRRIALSQSQTSEFESRPIELRSDDVLNGVAGLIGNTPLFCIPPRIPSLSDALNVEILAKAEFLNPGGSVKDRVAVRMIDDAERQGLLHPHTGSRIFEGTSGSTETTCLRALGAHVEQVRPASIVDKKQNIARQHALAFSSSSTSASVVSSPEDSIAVLTDSGTRGFFANQFENKSNYDAHFNGTGPEVWRQTNGSVRAFVSGAGVGRFLKSMDEDVVVCLADPEGSGLYNKVKHGVMFDQREKEGTKRRHQVDIVVEGIGINRLTQNIELALPIIDDAVRITDVEAVAMARYLVQHDGLFVGSSSACNLVACVRLAKKMGWRSGERIVTVLCDSGARHYSKFWNDEYLHKAGIPIDLSVVEDMLKGSESEV